MGLYPRYIFNYIVVLLHLTLLWFSSNVHLVNGLRICASCIMYLTIFEGVNVIFARFIFSSVNQNMKQKAMF